MKYIVKIEERLGATYQRPERYRDDKKTNWAVWGSIVGTAVGAGIVIPTAIWCIKNARK